MATFYILPARAQLEESLGNLLMRYLPGLPQPLDVWDMLADSLAADRSWPSGTFLIPRDDLPVGSRLQEVLIDSYGAESGDRIVEVATHAIAPRQWLIVEGMSEAAAAR